MSQEMPRKKKNKYTSEWTQGAQNYLCKLCGDKGNYASKCSKPQLLYVTNEYERVASKYLHVLHSVEVFTEGVAFVVKHKESKITQMMNSSQFSKNEYNN
jgi:hypothetical protein